MGSECSPDHVTVVGGLNEYITIEDNQDKDCFSIRATYYPSSPDDVIHICDWRALKAAVDKHQSERGGEI